MEEKYTIHNIEDGMIDFRRNASDTSRSVFQACMKSGKLCVAFAVVLYDPDLQCPEHERWSVGSFLPQSVDVPEELRTRMYHSFQYLGEQVARIWTGRSAEPYKGKEQ